MLSAKLYVHTFCNAWDPAPYTEGSPGGALDLTCLKTFKITVWHGAVNVTKLAPLPVFCMGPSTIWLKAWNSGPWEMASPAAPCHIMQINRVGCHTV